MVLRLLINGVRIELRTMGVLYERTPTFFNALVDLKCALREKQTTRQEGI